MAKKNEAWGIEVGASAIKAVKLARHGNEVLLEDYEVLKFKQVLSTPDIDADEHIQVMLDQLIQKHDISRAQTVVSVPGHLAFARFAKLPPVEPKKIPDIVKFEAVQQIPFPIEQVEWDYQVFQQEDSPDVEVGIFAITKERIAQFLSNYRMMNIRIDQLTLSPLAVYNAFAYDNAEDPETEGVMYMDIGTVSTDVIIVEHGGIWLRTLPIGGNHFTEALVKAFKISHAKAEKLKREAATSKYAKQIFQAMRGVFADLVQEVQRSLGYYQSLNRDAEVKKLVGVGSTFRLPGLSKFLKQQLQIEVTRPDGFKRIATEDRRESDLAESALNLTTAYGLALQGLGLDTVSANVLPSSMQRARLWKAKQPWIAAAAACLAVGAVAAAVRFYTVQAQYAAEAQDTTTVLNQVERTARNWQNQLDDAASDPRQRIENVRRTLDYRSLWPLLIEDISAAMRSIDTPGLLDAETVEVVQQQALMPQRVYLKAVTADYVPKGEADTEDAQSQPGMQGGMGFDPMMDPMMGGMPPGMGGPGMDMGPRGAQTAQQGEAGKQYKAEEFFGDEDKAPRFRVTITGITPNTEPSAMLRNGIVGSLRQNADRPDRPYRIEIPQTPIPFIRQHKRAGVDRQGGQQGPMGMMGMGMDPGMYAPPMDQRQEGAEPRETQWTINDLLPANPLDTAQETPLMEFQIVFDVVLKEPMSARSAAIGAATEQQDAEPEAPADEPTPEPVGEQASLSTQETETDL